MNQQLCAFLFHGAVFQLGWKSIRKCRCLSYLSLLRQFDPTSAARY